MENVRLVLVTGATGFIGRQTVTSLEKSGWRVIRGMRFNAKLLEDGEVHLDLNYPSKILELEKGPRFDAIVHLGANISWSGTAKEEMFVPNVLATGYLAYLARLWNAHFVYASTAIVCGVRSEDINSHTPVLTDTAYAQSKFLGEQLIETSGIHYCIFRIGGVFGHNGPGHLGLNRAIDGALKGNLPIQSGSGTALRNYIYVKDVAEAILFALRYRVEGTHFLAGSEVVSVSQMLQIICDVFLSGQQPKIISGANALSQVIEASSYLPKTKGFREALVDIKGNYQ